MAYIIINGRSSEDVRGLLISTVPPITKPKMRTQTDTVDGRDGDIVKKLGYEAYNKKITVGLYGSYDVDEVIAFFNTSGRIIFSNEPDKYYRFSVIDAIDFEKLIRFKTATVTFHVQPFKYSALTLGRTLMDNAEHAARIINYGNVDSLPTLTITGSGTIGIYIDSVQKLSIALADQGYITIDAEEMNAYKDGVLKNRIVTGDYGKVIFPPGASVLSWSGSVTSIELTNYSRWV